MQFTSEGSTLSGCDIELVGAGYRFSLIKKRFAAGEWVALVSLAEIVLLPLLKQEPSVVSHLLLLHSYPYLQLESRLIFEWSTDELATQVGRLCLGMLGLCLMVDWAVIPSWLSCILKSGDKSCSCVANKIDPLGFASLSYPKMYFFKKKNRRKNIKMCDIPKALQH